MQLLSTKLSIPPLRSRMVLRQRLLQKLNQGLDCGFVLVSAPAGYGKTTILSAWLSRSEFPSVWLSLDVRDNDLNRFLTYLTAAFQGLDPSINEESEFLVGFSQQVEVEAYLTTLINHLSQLRNPTCLILDDFHEIQNQLVHQAVNFLLEHHPPSLRLVIATRVDPPLPLAKLRSRSCMVEIRMADLRFTVQEATEFLNRTMGLKSSPEDVARVTSRTEGWIAGLQMAALSMQNSDYERLATYLRRLPKPDEAGHQILVVEDDASARELLKRMLTSQGWKVFEGKNGRVALEQMQTVTPHLVVLDLMMPDMDGFEFITELRKNEKWRKIPVVIVTAKEITIDDRERLNGYVQNNGSNVVIEVDREAEEFVKKLKASLPPLANLESVEFEGGLSIGELGNGFRIVASEKGVRGVGIPNDAAICYRRIFRRAQHFGRCRVEGSGT